MTAMLGQNERALKHNDGVIVAYFTQLYIIVNAARI
jgi:hypothetical protein